MLRVTQLSLFVVRINYYCTTVGNFRRKKNTITDQEMCRTQTWPLVSLIMTTNKCSIQFRIG